MSEQQFDVFLCHNSLEKETVEKIRDQLKEFGIYAWLDKYDFEPFRPWQDQLEEIIPVVKAAAVFIGPSGVGPWADIEMREFIKEFAERKIRMGLVILPGCSEEVIESVPRFVKSFHWVDFRSQNPDPMMQLIWGITGERPDGFQTEAETAEVISIQEPNPTPLSSAMHGVQTNPSPSHDLSEPSFREYALYWTRRIVFTLLMATVSTVAIVNIFPNYFDLPPWLEFRSNSGE